jgi:ankyrin repeat protein
MHLVLFVMFVAGCREDSDKMVFHKAVGAIESDDDVELTKMFRAYPGLMLAKDRYDDSTLLHKACETFKAEKCVAFLLSNQADPNAVDTFGETPLHRLVRAKQYSPSIVKKLLSSGANPALKNKAGKTPAEYLIEDNDISVAAIREILTHSTK